MATSKEFFTGMGGRGKTWTVVTSETNVKPGQRFRVKNRPGGTALEMALEIEFGSDFGNGGWRDAESVEFDAKTGTVSGLCPDGGIQFTFRRKHLGENEPDCVNCEVTRISPSGLKDPETRQTLPRGHEEVGEWDANDEG